MFVDQPESAGIFVDFDGTLAPIVEDPDQARPLPGTVELLARLAARYRKVAVVSGRPLAYLAERLAGADEVELVGLYGLERQVSGASEVEVSDESAQSRWRGAVETVAAEAERRISEDPKELAGLLVEPKGLTVTLHYRKAASLRGWVEAFASDLSGVTGLVAHPGKMSVELRPPIPTDKGSVVATLAGGLRAVCYIGDDVGDLAAFEALEALSDRGVSTLAVGVRSGIGDETPATLIAAADLVVDGPEGVLGLLRELVGS